MTVCRRLLTEYPEVVNGLDRPGLVHAALGIVKRNVGFARGLLQAAGVGQVLRSSLGIVCACGAGTSARVSTSGPPARSMMWAFMVVLQYSSSQLRGRSVEKR